jgi:hypothetical protein
MWRLYQQLWSTQFSYTCMVSLLILLLHRWSQLCVVSRKEMKQRGKYKLYKQHWKRRYKHAYIYVSSFLTRVFGLVLNLLASWQVKSRKEGERNITNLSNRLAKVEMLVSKIKPGSTPCYPGMVRLWGLCVCMCVCVLCIRACMYV